ncbi:unnamed protein product [Symbiodinium necroappetens]|uniref:ubiquitinyl hydrolase 1 n=1 Tax=Symbiodinium necroappetens TaxID=1628268 RepID=A0A812JI85_9DINO|nr:unnamed protein product [Symbiodinium necroappetens]
MLQELLVSRCWDVQEHPEWLVFEVEGGLQIRPVQYQVAKKLMDDPGSVVQLNMGEGKTRVILPMLILHWAGRADAGEPRLLRITALTSLLHELYDFMHRHLCASVLLRRVFVMPFHRDVQLRPDDIKQMISCLDFCRQSGGVVLVAPEHRLSLQLKWHELRLEGKHEMCQLLARLSSIPVRDLLDESDEVLRHKYQLIYAVGSPIRLPQGPERWETATALLRVLQQSERVAQLLSGKALREPDGEQAFDRLRFIPGRDLDRVMPSIRLALLEDLMGSPPYELAWLANYRTQGPVVRFLTMPDADASCLPSGLPEDRFHTMLALRGFLACAVLEHCMQKRHSVEYGVGQKHAKRLAVPYKASNTPSERSEFGHPDCAIMLTLLSYFYDGLSRAQLKQAFEALLSYDESVQKGRYDAWFSLSQGMKPVEETRTVRVATMIDLSSEPQLDLLYDLFHMNFETIAFWVCQCVFPKETSQYPNKLVANAWNLADNQDGLVSGFSGTDDNHRVLPLQVTQQNLAHLAGTNGKMINMIMDNPDFLSLPPGQDQEGNPSWLRAARFAVERGVHALIDCGALTAGALNADIAVEILRLLANRGSTLQGVVYFDASKKDWIISDRHGRCLPKNRSPVREHECFAFFDEARSRGADLKLAKNAKAMVTVGLRCGKDKLMQAIGRMRMLGKGQTLEFLASEEVSKKVREMVQRDQTEGKGRQKGKGRLKALKEERVQLTSQHLLEWVMANTVAAAEEALSEWAKQGLLFSSTRAAPELAVLDETVELSAFYKEAVVPKEVAVLVRGEAERTEQRAASSLRDSDRELMQKIQHRADQYGNGVQVAAGVLDEEYERELEVEKEVEKEVERQVPTMTPYHEEEWDVSQVVHADSVVSLKIETFSIPDVFAATRSLNRYKSIWPKVIKVYCTRNFRQAINEAAGLDEYLRPVDAVVAFESGGLLLLSEREGEQALVAFWTAQVAQATRPRACFVNMPLWRKGFSSQPAGLLPNVAGVPRVLCDPPVLVSLQVFMGDTSFKDVAQQESLRALATSMGRDAAGVMKQLVRLRGMLHRYERSDMAWMLNSL